MQGDSLKPDVITWGEGIGPTAKVVIETIANEIVTKSIETNDQTLNDMKFDLSISSLKS